MNIPNRSETIVLGAFFLLANVSNSIYAAFGLAPSSGFLLLYYVGTAWLIAWWINADMRRLGSAPLLDLGWFAFLAWPIVLPYHLIKTRGLKGLVTLAGLLGLFVLSYLVGLLLLFAVIAVRQARQVDSSRAAPVILRASLSEPAAQHA